jgi:nucleoredoxin
MYKVSGIPTLVFLDGKTGAVLTTEGREAISEDDFLSQFPYRPKEVNVIQELGATLRTAKGGTVATQQALQGKEVLGLYFSAHWCPPCQQFTPVLSQKYTELKQAGKSLELVFVSSDRDAQAFQDYHSHMTFLALPYDARGAKNTLSKHFKVSGIPTLVFVDARTGALITDEGRGAISSDTFIQDFPYYPKAVNDLSRNLTGIQDLPSLVVLMDRATKEVQQAVITELTVIAESELKKPEAERAVHKFFTGCGDGPVDQIRGKCGLGGSKSSDAPQMLILDLSDSGAYYLPASQEASAANVRAFMQQFASKSLKKHVFGENVEE